MNYLDLFSGIGGFALGAYWAGMRFENHYFSEVEPYAVELYQKRFPDAIPLGDITKHKEWELADGQYIITGGFPCQDISVAGKGAGIEGSRSGLWSEYWRIIREIRPRYAIIENVSALTHRGLDVVLSNLAEIGYDAEWTDIRAEDMGAPHRRERIWIVAYPNSDSAGLQERRRAEPVREEQPAAQHMGEEMADTGQFTEGYEGNGLDRRYPDSQAKGFGATPGDGLADGGEEMADTDSKRPQERERQTTETIQRADSGDRETGTYWAVEPNVGRLAHGVSRRVDRLKGLGNAIVPQIAELLFRQIHAGIGED